MPTIYTWPEKEHRLVLNTPARRVTWGACAWHACAEGDVSLLCCQQLPPCRALAKLCVTLVFKEGVLNVTLASGFIQAFS